MDPPTPRRYERYTSEPPARLRERANKAELPGDSNLVSRRLPKVGLVPLRVPTAASATAIHEPPNHTFHLHHFYLILYHALCFTGWSVILGIIVYHLAVDNLYKPHKHITTPGHTLKYLQYRVKETFSVVSDTSVLKRGRDLYPVVGALIAAMQLLEAFGVVNVFTGVWKGYGGENRARLVKRWIVRSILIWYVVDGFPNAQKTVAFAIMALGWSMEGCLTHLHYAAKAAASKRDLTSHLLHIARAIASPCTHLAEVYCIYISIPSSCLWSPWNPFIEEESSMLVDWISRWDTQSALKFALSPRIKAFALDSIGYGLYSRIGDYARSMLFFVWAWVWIRERM